MPFHIIRNDITKVKADAIVNTANPEVAVGDGVDSAVYKAAGRERLLEERRKIGRLEPGTAAVTPAFDLDADYIIHVSGPRWNGGNAGETEVLRKCYDTALALAADRKCKSVAFPLLSTRTYGFPQRLGMETAVDAFTAFLENNEMDIILAVFGEKSVRISGELGREVENLIDNEYVSKALAEEYINDGIPDLSVNKRRPGRMEMPKGMPSELTCESVCKREVLPKEYLPIRSVKAPRPESVAAPAGNAALDDVLKGIYKESFEKHLQMLINKKGLKNSEVYAAANISKQYFSKLLKGAVKPSKEKVLALALGLRLNMDETIDFMRMAGYALSPISQTDAVVSYFIEHKIYSVIKIDIVLFDYGLDPLSNG